MTETVLEMKGVSKIFRGAQAVESLDTEMRGAVLRNIDLAIPSGRVVGLLGKNGAGKTTLLRCALGLMRPSAGTIRLFGEDPWKLSAAAKERIGYVPQRIDLYPWMLVRQMVAHIAAFYPRWNPALADELLKKWEMPREAAVGTLSEGQTQKLGLILALGHEPDLLVLDEPAASLDPEARRTFLAAIVDIAADRHRTVILSTHLTSDLERVATDIVLLKDGAIRYFGSIDDLKDSREHNLEDIFIEVHRA